MSDEQLVNVVDPDTQEIGSILASQLKGALEQGYTHAAPEDVDKYFKEEKYGSVGEQIKTGLEGAASAATFGLSTGIEEGFGVKPEDIRARREVNPASHMAGQIGGLAATALIPGVAEAGLSAQGAMSGAGSAAVKALGLGGEGAGFLSNVGASAARGAAEMALFQGGDEVSKMLSSDPEQSAGSALVDIGIGALLGAGAGGVFGTVPALWKLANEGRVGQAIKDLNNHVSGSVLDSVQNAPAELLSGKGLGEYLGRPKPDAKNFIEMAEKNNWPVLEGMVSASKEIQMAEDALLNGPPTIASIQRRSLYENAFESASKSVEEAMGPTHAATETHVGRQIKESLVQKLEAEHAPISELYRQIEPYQQAIPLSERSANSVSRNVLKIINEENLIPGTPRHDFVKTMAEGLKGIDNLERLKNFRTELWKNAGPETKQIAGVISEKLGGIEERAIKRFAETMRAPEAKGKILDLIKQTEDAKGMYREFREKLQTLGDSLGKKKIYGPQNFIDFVKDDLNPQSLARKIFNENNVQFAQWFAKSFPEEMEVMAGYQRSLLKGEALKDGVFDPKRAIKKAFDLEPEMRKILFNEEQLQKLFSAERYLGAFPPKFNPSGTAHESAYRSFFEHPAGAIIGNIRDYGIQGFIKMFGHAAPGAEASASSLFPVIGKATIGKEPNSSAFKTAVDYAMGAARGAATVARASKAVFKPGAAVLPLTLIPSDKSREKLDKRLQMLQKNPDELLKTAGELGYYMPDHATALAKHAMGAVDFLNGVRPKTDKQSPLDSVVKPSGVQKAAYDRALGIAEQPLVVLHHIKEGTLTPQDVVTMKTVAPALYGKLVNSLSAEMIEHTAKGLSVPYKTRLGLSLFMGQALDSTMTPQAIIAAQPKPQQMPAEMQGQRPKHSMTALNKLSPISATPQQARVASKLNQH